MLTDLGLKISFKRQQAKGAGAQGRGDVGAEMAAGSATVAASNGTKGQQAVAATTRCLDVPLAQQQMQRQQPPAGADGSERLEAAVAGDQPRQQGEGLEVPAAKRARVEGGEQGIAATSPAAACMDADVVQRLAVETEAAMTATSAVAVGGSMAGTAPSAVVADARAAYVEVPLRRVEKRAIDFRGKTVSRFCWCWCSGGVLC